MKQFAVWEAAAAAVALDVPAVALTACWSTTDGQVRRP